VRKPVITIDGPAGAGKSTIARALARKLGLRFLDTGSMYRAFTWKALESRVDLKKPAALVAMIRASTLVLDGTRVELDGRDITKEIRDERVTAASKHLADPPEVRAEMVRLQQEYGREGGLVTEGRDQGSVVFPAADFKFYLDASIEERARRRLKELEARGEKADFEELKTTIHDRDERDRKRAVGALKRPDGAIVVDTSAMTVEQVVDALFRVASGRGGP
jgi:cytidylate kinase